jgi:hypothetical protein
MTENESASWAKAENPEVEQAKDAYTEAKEAEKLRQQISQHAAGAVKHGVDRDWANGWLARLGAAQITGIAEYRMNTPITGNYGWRTKAHSRVEAAEKFLEQAKRVAEQGKITADGSYDNVYDVVFLQPGIVSFHAGPEDQTNDDAETLDLAGLRAAIRNMIKEGIAQQGWNLGYATRAMASMGGMDPLPAATTKMVKVPVSGFTEVSVMVFDGDGDEAVQAAAASKMARAGNVYIKPEEIGAVTVASEATGDEYDNDEGYDDNYGDPF